MEQTKDYTQLNGLALAYVGDAIYEVYIRDYLIRQGQTKPNRLHHNATKYVSARAQAYLIEQMKQIDLLNETEMTIFRRGRNAKSHTVAKNTDVATYRSSTGFEAVMGYLHLTGQKERMETLIEWCIQTVGEKHE